MHFSVKHWLLGAALSIVALSASAKSDKREPGNFTLLFVGGAQGDLESPTLSRLEDRLRSLDPESGLVVFTGNYGEGELPAEGEPGRARAEAAVLAHVSATSDFFKRGGKVYFLVGDRDFAGGGTKAVLRLRAFLNRAFTETAPPPNDAEAAPPPDDEEDASSVDVMPGASCGEPTLLKLDKNLALLLVNSQWWMQDWANDPQANAACEVKTRQAFQVHLQEALKASRGQRLVIASHHPLRSDGRYGGSFTAHAHLEPAPILGTAWVLARKAGLVEQYQNHPMVRSYLEILLAEAQRYGSFILASGHDQSLQFLQVEKQVQLISGTSANSAEATIDAKSGEFASATPGWVELQLEPSGAGKATFVSGESQDKVLFEATLPALVTPGAAPEPPKPFPSGAVISTYTKRKVWHLNSVTQLFVGSFYSDAYSLELPYETLNLDTELGGLKPKGIGGGTQTNSLKLRDAQGGSWAMRAVTKDSSRVLSWPQSQATLINRLLEHGFTATHPEAALAMPRLAEAMGVLHTEPRLLYLPDQEALGDYRGFITDELVLLEQKPKAPKEGTLPESQAGPPSAEGKTSFKSTQKTIDKTIDKPWKHRVDQEAMLRARLLDIFVGDWDRHDGQWSFAATPNADGTKTYTPIPRDRDQAFANYDGLLLFLARIATPVARVTQPFRGDYGSVVWSNFNARNLDPIVLNRIPHKRWLEIAKEAQDALTDAVIDQAFSGWHPEAYALDGARLAKALKSRRDKLVQVADEYFALINHKVDVLGSSSDDQFDLWFQPGGAVRVVVQRRGKHADDPPFFDRTFEPDETSELRLYALEGDDILYVHGDPRTPIDIRFIGGEGKDTVSAAPGEPAALGNPAEPLDARALRVYDSKDGLTVDPSVRVSDERSSRAELNQYDPDENHDPDYVTFFPGLVVSSDQGAYIGGRATYTVQGFKKSPFAARHQLGLSFAPSTLGLALDYSGLFPQSIGMLDQQLDAAVFTQGYTRNFYGLTNQYVPDSPVSDYNRLRQALYQGRYGWSYSFSGEPRRVGAQLTTEALVTEATPGRFVSVSPDVAPDSLGTQLFAGARLFAETNTFDDLVLPQQGIALHASLEGRYDVVHQSRPSVTYKGAAAIAIPIDRARRFVLISRASLVGIVGEHPFYFAPTLGGSDLRAYNPQQFAGTIAFSQTSDLRVDLIRIYSGLPGTIGLNLALDHGRVFGSTIPSHEYHVDYGGGVWWTVLDAVGVSFNYYRGLEGNSRILVAVGPLFSQTGF